MIKESGLIRFRALDFFSGSGLVTEGLKTHFDVIWANDNDPQKNLIYLANFKDNALIQSPIEKVSGREVPPAELAWASFPCQDLSLAGNLKGIEKHTRSGLFWEWIRILDEMGNNAPPVLAVENVIGFLIADQGNHFKAAYEAITSRGYLAGALVVNASLFVPQSRQRAFLIAVKKGLDIDGLIEHGSTLNKAFHRPSVLKAYQALEKKDSWIWWRLPIPPHRAIDLPDIYEPNAPVDSQDKTSHLLEMLSKRHRQELNRILESVELRIGTAYRRVRKEGLVKSQRLEIRFDNLAGCLRTPNGGSSRQILIIANRGEARTRVLTVRETARLMGVRDSFKLPGSYNEVYWAMGDAVAVPVTRWLTKHLLSPLVARYSLINSRSASAKNLAAV